MNTDLMFSSKTEMWATPQDLFNTIDSKYNFNLDVCAIHENAKCKNYFTPEIDGLSQSWEGNCWMNPPYGKEIYKWIEKAYVESIENKKCLVVALLPARVDTKWFHNFIYNKKNVKVEFLKGRVKFGDAKNSAPFPSMIVVFNHKP